MSEASGIPLSALLALLWEYEPLFAEAVFLGKVAGLVKPTDSPKEIFQPMFHHACGGSITLS